MAGFAPDARPAVRFRTQLAIRTLKSDLDFSFLGHPLASGKFLCSSSGR
jgi:hypothetical protein